MRRIFLSLVGVCLLFTVLLGARDAAATHFRSGTISWKVPDPAAPLQVEFTVLTSWRDDFTNPVTDLEFGDIGATNGAQGGTEVGSGTDANGNGYKVFEYTAVHTYAAAGSYTAFFADCCRVDALINGDATNTDYRVETEVGLTAGNSGGPSTASTAVIQLHLGGIRTFSFPVFDPDGDPISCRLATAAESGLTQPVPAVPIGGAMPTVAANGNDCTVTWDVTNAVAGQQYALHIVMESTHLGSISSTALDLIVEMVTPAPPLCAGSGQVIAPPGALFSAVVTGTDPGGTLDRSVINLPGGATLSPMVATMVSPFATTFSWTPDGMTDAGTSRVVLLSFTNQLNLTGTCALSIFVPQCAGFGQACSVGQGQCQANGTVVCNGAMDQCNAVAGSPQSELCNGLDDNCDGATDELNPEGGGSCATGLDGVCGPGTEMCMGGSIACVQDVGASVESCNGLDDDCDGATDEGNPEGGGSCSSGNEGVCEAGVELCQNGVIGCAQSDQPSVESCNGLDDNCDGTVDEDNPGGGGSCATGLLGSCGDGVYACSHATLICAAQFQATPESCNGLDDDCDGVVDEGLDNPSSCPTATLGVCGEGSPPSEEICDERDNDCDGAVDEGCDISLSGTGAASCTAAAPRGGRHPQPWPLYLLVGLLLCGRRYDRRPTITTDNSGDGRPG